MRRLLGGLFLMSMLACNQSGSKAQQQLEELKKKQAVEAKEKEAADDAKKNPKVAAATLPVPYDDTQATVIVSDGPCPEGLWALFGGKAPGDTAAEQKANAAKRKEVAEAARGKQYLIKLRGLKLSPYDEVAGKFTIEMPGTIDCEDSIGRIALAWSEAKAIDPGASAVHEGSELTQNVWTAKPLTFDLPMTSMKDAKEFEKTSKLGLSARVGFKLGKTAVDVKTKRVAKVSEKAAGETLSFGGGAEDWGAGRLINAEVLGIRVANQNEKNQLFEKK